MGAVAHRELLTVLRTRIAGLAGEISHTQPKVLQFGVPEIDMRLPDGGLRHGALHEVIGGGNDLTHDAAATLFVAGLLARTKGSVLWCLKARDIFAPGLANAGLDQSRVLYVEAHDEKSILQTLEEGLRHGSLAGVIGEVKKLSLTASRRLQLAAEKTRTLVFVLRRWSKPDVSTSSNAAFTRWRVSALPSQSLSVPGIGRAIWRLDLERCRGGRAASFIVEAWDAEGRLGASAVLADGSAAAAEAHPYAATG